MHLGGILSSKWKGRLLALSNRSQPSRRRRSWGATVRSKAGGKLEPKWITDGKRGEEDDGGLFSMTGFWWRWRDIESLRKGTEWDLVTELLAIHVSCPESTHCSRTKEATLLLVNKQLLSQDLVTSQGTTLALWRPLRTPTQATGLIPTLFPVLL